MDVREKLVELCEDLETLPCCDTYEGQADYLIAHGVTVQEWISVKDRLPKEGENVLVFRDNGFAVSEIYMTDYEGNPMWNYTGLGGDPTHWMPLPQPPKGEQE